MSNRFIFLEEELLTFDAKKADKGKTNKKNNVSKGQSRYALQQNPAAAAGGVAIAGAVIAGAGLGWKIFEFAWAQTEGDIRVKLARLEGAKYPSDDEAQYKNKGVWKPKNITVYEKITSKLGDEISAKFNLKFKYNGYGVGYVDMDHIASNDAALWGLNVEAKMMVDPNNYTSRNGGQSMSMIEVTFNYRFTRSIGNDIIKIKRYKIYGDGTVI